MDWYDEFIEENIRPEVKLLRDNGFNTISSNGFKRLVECQLNIDGDLKRLHTLLYDNGYKNYIIEIFLEIENEYIIGSYVSISFRDKK